MNKDANLADYYQMVLIASGVVATLFFGVFLYREIFPEYKIYQSAYQELEAFRSSYTGRPVPAFRQEVKQIVLVKEDLGPETIDRCISCHVAMKFSHFSPTRLSYDVNGNLEIDAEGKPVQEENPDYVFRKLEEKIAELQQQKKFAEIEKLEALKFVKVGEHTYDMRKVLKMHPPIGRELRPFEYHSMEEYGCTSCHGGNGRGLVTDRAHGPVRDGEYEESFQGPEPKFLEQDLANDPPFSKIFNHRPGHRLLFQTEPLLMGSLIEANCVQCHKGAVGRLHQATAEVEKVVQVKNRTVKEIENGIQSDVEAIQSLLAMKEAFQQGKSEDFLERLRKESNDYSLPAKKRKGAINQAAFLEKADPLLRIDQKIYQLAGNSERAKEIVDGTLEIRKGDLGSIFRKIDSLNIQKKALEKVQGLDSPLKNAPFGAGFDQMDALLSGIHRGEQLFVTQGCYACHRIAGFARGGVGPELTYEGKSYPWFIKESIVWPQADLKTSTMPNMRLDHEELENLVTYLISQKGERPGVAQSERKGHLRRWEEGEKLPWERAILPNKVQDVEAAMKIFATEGCAACHRMTGFMSNVGFASPSYEEEKWFSKIFPEDVIGSQIIEAIEKHSEEIDKRIVEEDGKAALLEQIQKDNPGVLESFYSNFKFAKRSRNHLYQTLLSNEANLEKKDLLEKAHQEWKERVDRILKMHIQMYGLGRQIGPKVNWSGVYRSDQWLMEHFWKPTRHIPRSIMPVFPFDNTKFLSLTNMLNRIAGKNQAMQKAIWKERGFNPKRAFELHCAQCHGDYLQGNGPVAEWIYPIPKNLGNPVFLRNLTKERAIQSITHGVPGTPMPPWGEIALDKTETFKGPVLSTFEIEELVDWIFQTLPQQERGVDVQKWEYGPENVIQELKDAGDRLKSEDVEGWPYLSFKAPTSLNLLASFVEHTATPPSLRVEGVFDVRDSPFDGADDKHYFVKQKYYTTENIEAGEEYFRLNCAACHGKGGTGAGLRAGTMESAKPRMFTNLDWVHLRDDLRLIRSIKFGVPGTSMNAWGDQTSSLQRLQLVMYIRSLSQAGLWQESLTKTLYEAFQTSKHAVEMARTEEYLQKESLLGAVQEKEKGREIILQQVNRGKATADQATALYAEELEAKKNLRVLEQVDEALLKIISSLGKEERIFRNTGGEVIALWGGTPLFDAFLNWVQLQKNRFKFKENQLKFAAVDRDQVEQVYSELIGEGKKLKDLLEKEQKTWESKIDTQEKKIKIEELQLKIQTLVDLENSLTFLKAESSRFEERQKQLWSQVNDEL